jgi:hypothetical protein
MSEVLEVLRARIPQPGAEDRVSVHLRQQPSPQQRNLHRFLSVPPDFSLTSGQLGERVLGRPYRLEPT